MSDLKAYPRRPQSVAAGGKYPAGAGFGITGRKAEKAGKKAPSGVYARLLAAGQRLMTVIKHNEGGANKDLAKFADQIHALCDKWDR